MYFYFLPTEKNINFWAGIHDCDEEFYRRIEEIKKEKKCNNKKEDSKKYFRQVNKLHVKNTKN